MISQSLKQRIQSLDIREPYVWRLRLSSKEYDELKDYISSSIKDNGGHHDHLITGENAVLTLVFLAEWYKREYDVGKKVVEFDSSELADLWKLSGINIDKFVYTRSDGARLWQYSTYILGGLAIGHESSKTDNSRFFKTLCRIYNGEDESIESLDDSSRAIAFKESIRNKHSLYHYLQSILNGIFPFADEDLASSSDIALFLELVKKANDEVLQSKFRIEWIVTFSPLYENMSRHLRVWLNPEQVGEGLNQYMRYERLSYWGVPNPFNIRTFKISLRFLENGTVLESEQKALITFSNTGDLETGFISWNVEDYATFQHIPAEHFNRIEIVLRTDTGGEFVIQKQEVSEYMQLWKMNPYLDFWSSRKDAQKSTAVLFSDTWHAVLESTSEAVISKPFSDRVTGSSHVNNWLFIPDRITLENGKGEQVTLYNGVGYDHLTTKLHWESIQYKSGANILHTYLDPEFGQLEQEEVPVVFSAKDIVVRHFSAKTDEVESPIDEEDLGPLEFKGANGRYSEWTSDNGPEYGIATFRRRIRGQIHIIRCAYLPCVEPEHPVVRDFENTSIRFYSFNELQETSLCTRQDSIPLGFEPLVPCITIEMGNEQNLFSIDVYRPTLVKEVCFDGALIQYLHPNEELKLPYIFKDRVVINDFSEEGFRQYNCTQLKGVFSETYLNISENPNAGFAALAFWKNDGVVLANKLDEMAPSYIKIVFGSVPDNDSSCREWLSWDYNDDHRPEFVDLKDVKTPESLGIMFQRAIGGKKLAYSFPYYNDGDLWEDDYSKTSPLSAFMVACECDTYFFIMQPLRDIEKADMKEKVYIPLFNLRGGQLTDDDKKGLLRLAEEFAFCWESLGIELTKKK